MDESREGEEKAVEPKGSKRKEVSGEASPVAEKEPKMTKKFDEKGDSAKAGFDEEDLIMSVLPTELSQLAASLTVRHKHPKDKPAAAQCFWEATLPGGVRERMQTTVKAAAGSRRAAEQIARLCLGKFEEGLSRAEVMEYRGELYALCVQAAAGLPPPASRVETNKEPEKPTPRRSKKVESAGAPSPVVPNVNDVREKLQAEGRLESALRIEGRGEQRKNASINGVYASIKGGFEGRPAYEKVDGSTYRVLFYSARKNRWKVHESLVDATGGFAHAKTNDRGEQAPGQKLRWQVFDGGSAGYSDDKIVRCVPFDEKAATSKNAKKTKRSESEGSRHSTTSSSSGESSKEEAEEQEGAKKLAASAGIKEPNKMCAKMLVYSGLRCPCHYALRAECPQKKAK